MGGLWRFGPGRAVVIREENLRAALAGLPVEALRLSADVCAGLRQVGIEIIGHLLALPRGEPAIAFLAVRVCCGGWTRR